MGGVKQESIFGPYELELSSLALLGLIDAASKLGTVAWPKNCPGMNRIQNLASAFTMAQASSSGY
jgi:hypothetical protein